MLKISNIKQQNNIKYIIQITMLVKLLSNLIGKWQYQEEEELVLLVLVQIEQIMCNNLIELTNNFHCINLWIRIDLLDHIL
jgi:hypothetical protein